MKKLIIESPEYLRNGQFLFNFLEWLRTDKGYFPNQRERMADPFHIPDNEFTELLKEYQSIINLEGNEIR